MILWCSYCQRFIVERPPYEDLSVSHGICGTCFDRGDLIDQGVEQAREIAEFIRSTASALTGGALPDLGATIDEARRLRIRDVDLMLGVLQPTLYAIGHRFENGEISVEREHKVSQFVSAVLDVFARRIAPRNNDCHILLANAPDNTHTLGLRIFAELLAENGVHADVLTNARSGEVLERLDQEEYRTLGLSIALSGQLDAARELAAQARRRHPDLRIWAGGYLFKEPLDASETLEFDLVGTPADARDISLTQAAAS